MDKKNQNIYNMNYQPKKDNLRNEIAFQNILINPNNIFPIGPMSNIVLFNTNFLNKKREPQELLHNDIFNPGERAKRKYYSILILYIFYVEFISIKYINK